jgi:hypothetical protein
MPFVGNGEICALGVGLDVDSLRGWNHLKLEKEGKTDRIPVN